MDFSDYNMNQNFIDYILKKIIFIKPILNCFKDENNLQRIIKRGANKIQSQGDVTVAVKPLMKMLHEIQNEEEITEKCIQIFLEKEICVVISRTEISKGTLKIFLNRKSLLGFSLPSVADSCWNTNSRLSKYKVSLEMPEKEGNQALTIYRCYATSLFLKRFFELNGASVDTQSRCDNATRKNGPETSTEEDISSSLFGHVLSYNVSSMYHKNQDWGKNLILCSSVVQKNERSKLMMGHKDYIDLLKTELQKASNHKYEMTNNEWWNNYFDTLAEGCLILQLLSVNHLSTVKVDLEENSQNSREGAFVLYNHARLCTLFANFDKLVQEGLIPPLPPATDIDFSLLKHQEEWDLFWLFIHKYPELVEEMSATILTNTTIPSEKSDKTTRLTPSAFPTHVLAKYLHRLAHCISVYYNRIHILPSRSCDPSLRAPQHLLPVLWARMYLLKAVYGVLKSGLDLLGIVSPAVM